MRSFTYNANGTIASMIEYIDPPIRQRITNYTWDNSASTSGRPSCGLRDTSDHLHL